MWRLGSSSEYTWTLPPESSSVSAARELVVGVCRGVSTEHVEVARLLVSELVTNALQHGSGELTLVVMRDGEGLRVEVHDGSRVMPVLTESPSLRERGWGLRLVAALASSWGAVPRDEGQPGKQVWFAPL